ncbi:MAG: flagellar basal body L-ring protein FlgH [Nitrospinaceae bacterium]
MTGSELKLWGRNGVFALAVGLMALMLVSCAKSYRAVDPASAVVPNRLYQPPPPKRADGAIWPGDTSNNLLFVDTKARNLGDIVTVIIDESASSTQSATTDTSKKSENDILAESFLGLPSNLGIQNFLGSGAQFSPKVKTKFDRSNKGTGKVTREGKLKATLAATIIDVLPNGNFVIEATRSVTVNNEEQIMILRGTIRPVDINFKNTISSQLIANASITYTGEGVVADEQRVGWANRFISYIWPF